MGVVSQLAILARKKNIAAVNSGECADFRQRLLEGLIDFFCGESDKLRGNLGDDLFQFDPVFELAFDPLPVCDIEGENGDFRNDPLFVKGGIDKVDEIAAGPVVLKTEGFSGLDHLINHNFSFFGIFRFDEVIGAASDQVADLFAQTPGHEFIGHDDCSFGSEEQSGLGDGVEESSHRGFALP